ncbi:MAG: hypothetical protein GY716_00930 [bacterium]|nr:hypothetical protein [bacterium]
MCAIDGSRTFRGSTAIGLVGLGLVAILGLLPGRASAAVLEELRVDRIGVARGLPSDTITALCQDRAGFLWIGTREGLALHDGYTTRVFDHSIAESASLSDNYIRTIFEDRNGDLWIGTNSSGLNRLERATWSFETFRHDSADFNSLSHDSVYAIFEDSRGRLWVGTQDGLNLFRPDDRSFERWYADPDDPSSLPHSWISGIVEDGEGYLWVGTIGRGVARIGPDLQQVERFGPESAEDQSNLVFALTVGRDGRVWIGTQVGVLWVNGDSGEFAEPAFPASTASETERIVTSMAFDAEGKLWIGTWGHGLHAVDPTLSSRSVYRHETQRPDSLGADRVSAIASTPGGDLWVGTWGGGVNRFRGTGESFRSIGEERPGKPGLVYRDATAVFEDSSGGLWIGTWGKGLQRRALGDDRFELLESNSIDPLGLSTVLSLAETPDGAIWAGAMSGLTRIDPASGEAVGLPRRPEDPRGLGRGYVTDLMTDRDGNLWVGTGGGGVHRLAPDAQSFDRFRHDPNDPASLSNDFVTSLAESTDGTIWVGTRSGGLNALDPVTGRSRRYQPEPDDPASLSHHYVFDVLVTRDGELWVGTAGGGVNHLLDAEAGTFERMTEVDGLIADDVVGLLEDDDESLWIATRRGLSRYDPLGNRFANFGPGDGLAALEFTAGAGATGRNSLYFASAGGVTVVQRGTSFRTPRPSPVRITALRTLEGPVTGQGPPWDLDRIDIPYGTALTAQFTVLDYRHPHRYQYRMQGIDERWIDLEDRREPTFANLDPGVYRLSVRGRNAQGVWAETASTLEIHVVPPFWMTNWFRGLVAFVLVLGVWTGHTVRTSSLEKRNRELERLKNERERALFEAHESREQQDETYQRLRRLTRRLEHAKEEERRFIARELHDELGQALSAAKITLQRLSRKLTTPGDARLTTDAIELINGLISRVRELSLDLRPPLLDELGFMPALRGYAEGQSQRTGLRIRVVAEPEPDAMDPDVATAAFRVVQEALTNVVRHAGARNVEIGVDCGDERVRLSIRDDGAGFDLDQALEAAVRGRHLGLLGMRERVEALGGVLVVDSAPGRGTAITAELPLTDELPA